MRSSLAKYAGRKPADEQHLREMRIAAYRRQRIATIKLDELDSWARAIVESEFKRQVGIVDD